MIVQIITSRKVNGRWFLAPQQYTFVRQYFAPKSPTDPTGVMYYDILVGDVTYTIPAEIASVLNKETPSTDMRGAIERWEAYATKDIAAPLSGGHTDVVKQAEMFLDIDISKHHYQVDRIRLRELRNEQADFSSGADISE